MTPIIYFVRHGQTDWNAELRYQGQRDVPINELGRQQALRNGRVLNGMIRDTAGFDFIASPLSRTRETMEIVRSQLGLSVKEYSTDDRLLEVCYGDWEGKTLGAISARFPELIEARDRHKWEFVPPGEKSESYAMQAERFAPWLAGVQQPTVCVTHGGIMRCVWKIAGGLSAAEVSALTIYQDRILKLENGRLEWL